MKNLEATENKRKAHQYSENDDDDDEIKEISSKDKENRAASGSGSTQTTLNQLLKKDIREETCRQIARFFYTSAIPFNYVKNLSFLRHLN
jgi:CTP:phosphocholine cytidylyltransferase-like protein